MKHEIKIKSEYYKSVLNGTKNFEIRKDDRDYSVGDIVILKEWDGKNFTGKKLIVKIKYILRNCPEYGLKDGFCILGF